jgi:hypothetical protein
MNILSINADAASLAGSKKFGRYKGEPDKAVRGLLTEESPSVKMLLDAFKSLDLKGCGSHFDKDRRAKEVARLLAYSSEDVTKFGLRLVEFQDDEEMMGRAGIFLSALINSGRESDYVLHLSIMEALIPDLCFKNTKNVKVYGDVGREFGTWMTRGTLEVHGNAGFGLGRTTRGGRIAVFGSAEGGVGTCLYGGTIEIHGDAGYDIGTSMRGGKIIVHGNVSHKIGAKMEGGEIHIEGEILHWPNPSHMPEMKKGKIYHKGKLIIDKADVKY